MVIYEVSNKVFCLSFEGKKDAQKYLGEHGTAINGLQLREIYVVDDTEGAKTPKTKPNTSLKGEKV